MNKKIKPGKIVIPANAHPWEHELIIAKALAQAGYDIEFIEESTIAKTADFKVNDIEFELKSPESSNLAAIERNLKRAAKQSHNLVFDSSRMKGLRDDRIFRNLHYYISKQTLIRTVIFIDKKQRIKVFTI